MMLGSTVALYSACGKTRGLHAARALSEKAQQLLLGLANSSEKQLHRKRMLPDVQDFRIDGKQLLGETVSLSTRAEWDAALTELKINGLLKCAALVNEAHKIYELTAAGYDEADEVHS